jgi:hypothetical protein
MGAMTPQVGNAVCNAMGKLLRIFEMEHKYGTTSADGKPKTLQLVRQEDGKFERLENGKAQKAAVQ